MPPPTNNPVIRNVVALLGRFMTQDQARSNAGQAAVRMGHRRRQVEDVDQYLDELHDERDRVARVERLERVEPES